MKFSFTFGFTNQKQFLRYTPYLITFAVILVFLAGNAFGQAFTESFDTVTDDNATPVAGWTAINHSTNATTRLWFTTNPAVIAPQSGGAISTNFQSVSSSGSGVGTISNWLISPNRTFSNGDKISFYTSTVNEGAQFADRLQVRLSLAGTSTNIGTGPTQVGDFSTVLLDINPSYDLTSYPEVMTQFTITISGLAAPTAGRIAFRYFVESGGPQGANSDTIGIDTFAYTPASTTAPVQHTHDFDGDGKTDFAIVRVTNVRGGVPLAGQTTWFIANATGTGGQQSDFGNSFDFFLDGDYDGDKKSDIAVFRPGTFATFYILNSATNTVRAEQYGTTNDDISVAADYDGDGKTDLAVYRASPTVGAPSYWIYRTTQGGPDFFVQWGANQGVDAQQNAKGDFPLAGDYDGDGKADFIVYRNDGQAQGILYRRLSGGSMDNFRVGLASDTLVPGDFDGDGKMDVGFARGDAASGQIDWYYKPSSAPAEAYRYLGRWGSASLDFPLSGDYDGDGKSDLAVWRGVAEAPLTQNRFYINQSTSGFKQFVMGKTGDFPVANFNTH